MQLADNVRSLETSHHEGDKEQNNIQQEAHALLSQGTFNNEVSGQKTQELVKDGLLPQLDLAGKMGNTLCKISDDAALDGSKFIPAGGGGSGHSGGGGNGHGGEIGGGEHDLAGKGAATDRAVGQDLPGAEVPTVASRHQ